MNGEISRLYDVVTMQSAIIDLQKRVIDRLFEGLMQHMAAEEVESDYANEIWLINEAAGLRKTIEQ